MFYKFATVFACFFVLGQAMAAEDPNAKGGAGEQGPSGAVSKGAANEQGPAGPSEGPAMGGEQGPLGPNAEKAGSEGPGPNVGGNEAGPNVGGGELGPNEGGAAKGPETTPFPVAAVTFDELKLACVDPARFHVQLQPGNIRIACESRETAWVPDTTSSIPGDCTRTVTGELFSNKVVIGQQQYSYAVPPNDLSCPRFKEVIKTFRSEYGTTCEEILAYADLGQFCQERLSSDPNAIPELIVVEDSGRTLDTCGAAVTSKK